MGVAGEAYQRASQELQVVSPGLRGLLGYLWKYRWRVVLGLVGVVVSDVAQLIVPLVIRRTVDELAQGSIESRLLVQAAALLTGLALLSLGAKMAWRHFLHSASQLAQVDIRRRLLDKALKLPTKEVNETKVGELMALATNDVSSVQQALAYGLLALFDSLFFGVCALGAMLALDWKLTLWSILPFPVLGLIMGITLRKIYGRYDKVQKSFELLTEKVRESIQGMRVLRAAEQSEGDQADFEVLNRANRDKTMDYVKIDATFRPLIMVFAGSSTALLLLVGGSRVVEGLTTVGTFAAFTTYLAQLTWPMIAAGWMFVLVQRGSVSMARIEKLLATPEEEEQPVLDRSFSGQLEVRQLTFTYPGAEKPALEDVSFTVEAGQSLGLVGEVGSGKTTLLLLLNRFFDPPKGTIFLDGVDITTLNLAELRAQFSWVPQEPFLFSDTIEANLRLAHPEVDPDQLLEACRRATLDQEVKAFPKGYETLLGERGISLSGGQRQRLCLARALLKPAPVSLFDDTLSAVDHETEHRILRQWQEGEPTTRLVVSHRLSAVQDLDRIVVLSQGRVIDAGQHAELIDRPGFYHDLHQLQSLEVSPLG